MPPSMEVVAEPGSPPAIDGAMPLGLVKAYYFAFFCFAATYHRYLTLYFESEGLRAGHIGILLSVDRLLRSSFTPLWGMLADRTKKARTITQVSLALGVLPFLALAVPSGQGSAKFHTRAVALWLFGASAGPQSALRDALARAACAQDPDLWGQARVYGAVGWGLAHLLLGPLIDLFGFAAMFISNVVLAAILFLVTRSSVPEACGEVKAEVNFRVVCGIFLRHKVFFVNAIMVGAGFSMVEGMLFLLLQEMKASTMLCGLSVVVTVVFELPVFRYSKSLLSRLGMRRMILLGQAAWVVRALFYASMQNKWSVLFIEPLHGVTFALVWTASLQYVAEPTVSGPGLEASAQGMFVFCFQGLGSELGLAIGGWLFDALGSHAVYAVFAVGVLASGVVYACYGSDAGENPGPGKVGSAAGPLPMSLGWEHAADDDDTIVQGTFADNLHTKMQPEHMR